MINQQRIKDLCKINAPDGKPYYLTLHSTYISETMQLLGQAENYMHCGNIEEVGKVFDVIAVSALAIGATNFSSIAKKITQVADSNDTESIQVVIDEAKRIFQLSEDEIKKFLEINGIK